MDQRVIRLEYELKVKGGDLVESSAQRGPLELVLGQRRLLPVLEERIAKLAVGEEVTGELAAAEAFGNESLLPVKEIPVGEFPEGAELTAGRIFEAKGPDGQPVRFRIVEPLDASVKVIFLHPLAAADLEYRLKVLAIDEPRRRPLPPPLPAHAIGIDSAAIQIFDERNEN
jgi:FKBP-type peptidyl-prolyl cis-trans isomerase 2